MPRLDVRAATAMIEGQLAGWPTGAMRPGRELLVAGRGHDEAAGGERALGDGLEHRREGRSSRHRRAERHRDHDAGVADGPVDAGQDPAVGPPALVAEDLPGVDLGLGRDAVRREGLGLPRTARGADAVRAVAVSIVGRLAGDERGPGDGAPDEVRMAGVEAGVQHRDAHALARPRGADDAGGLQAPRGVAVDERLGCADLSFGTGRAPRPRTRSARSSTPSRKPCTYPASDSPESAYTMRSGSTASTPSSMPVVEATAAS